MLTSLPPSVFSGLTSLNQLFEAIIFQGYVSLVVLKLTIYIDNCNAAQVADATVEDVCSVLAT